MDMEHVTKWKETYYKRNQEDLTEASEFLFAAEPENNMKYLLSVFPPRVRGLEWNWDPLSRRLPWTLKARWTKNIYILGEMLERSN